MRRQDGPQSIASSCLKQWNFIITFIFKHSKMRTGLSFSLENQAIVLRYMLWDINMLYYTLDFLTCTFSNVLGPNYFLILLHKSRCICFLHPTRRIKIRYSSKFILQILGYKSISFFYLHICHKCLKLKLIKMISQYRYL
jgi:hypothetical protein